MASFDSYTVKMNEYYFSYPSYNSGNPKMGCFYSFTFAMYCSVETILTMNTIMNGPICGRQRFTSAEGIMQCLISVDDCN